MYACTMKEDRNWDLRLETGCSFRHVLVANFVPAADDCTECYIACTLCLTHFAIDIIPTQLFARIRKRQTNPAAGLVT